MNDCSFATKFVVAGAVGDVVALGSTHRALMVEETARVTVSCTLRTMNWLPNTRRDVPVTLFETACTSTGCVELPTTVDVSTRAN